MKSDFENDLKMQFAPKSYRERFSNVGFKRSIDLIELSDAFRRHAHFDDPETVRALVREARRFSGFSTWYDPGEKFRHEELSGSIGKSLRRMADLAVKLGADEIELPVSGDRRSPFAQFFRRAVEPKLDLPVKVSLQKGEYSKDLSFLGPIDWRCKTPIDEGLRGMADIKSELRATW